MIGDVWIGEVIRSKSNEEGRGGVIAVKSSLWFELPPIGTRFEMRVTYRSPYWSLVEDDD